MSIHLMKAKVVLEPIGRLYSLCMYISMETVVGASTIIWYTYICNHITICIYIHITVYMYIFICYIYN